MCVELSCFLQEHASVHSDQAGTFCFCQSYQIVAVTHQQQVKSAVHDNNRAWVEASVETAALLSQTALNVLLKCAGMDKTLW